MFSVVLHALGQQHLSCFVRVCGDFAALRRACSHRAEAGGQLVGLAQPVRNFLTSTLTVESSCYFSAYWSKIKSKGIHVLSRLVLAKKRFSDVDESMID